MDNSKIRTNHKIRLQAFDLLIKLKNKKISLFEIVSKIHKKFGVPIGTLYDWYNGAFLPYGRKGKISYSSDLFYVLGALLGDGCLYKWKITHNHVILVGDKEFTRKNM